MVFFEPPAVATNSKTTQELQQGDQNQFNTFLERKQHNVIRSLFKKYLFLRQICGTLHKDDTTALQKKQAVVPVLFSDPAFIRAISWVSC